MAITLYPDYRMRAFEIASPEWTVKQVHAVEHQLRKAYTEGMTRAVIEIQSFGAQGCGGSGAYEAQTQPMVNHLSHIINNL